MMETAKRTYARVFLLVTGLLVLAALTGRQVSPSVALIVLVAGVVFLGLPHGALDPLVARQAFAGRDGYGQVRFYALYLALVLAFGMFWALCPTLGLALFLLVSAFHFGTDWELRGIALTRFGYGLVVVTLPALRFPAQVATVYATLGTAHATLFVAVSRFLAPLAIALAALGAASRLRDRSSDMLELLLIVAAAALLQPLVFFTCYFALLHSPRHMLATAEAPGITSLQRIYRETGAVVAATLLLAGAAFALLPRAGADSNVLRIVFVGLAALTMPHMLLDALAEAHQK